MYPIVPVEDGVERTWAEEAFVVACSLAQRAMARVLADVQGALGGTVRAGWSAAVAGEDTVFA